MFDGTCDRAALVLVDQPTKPLTTQDRTDCRPWTRASRRLKTERAVRPVVIVVVDVCVKHAWPFGVVELVWSGVAVRRYLVNRRPAIPHAGEQLKSPPTPT